MTPELSSLFKTQNANIELLPDSPKLRHVKQPDKRIFDTTELPDVEPVDYKRQIYIINSIDQEPGANHHRVLSNESSQNVDMN